MKIADIVNCLESIAHLSMQEPYDNAGLITGNPGWNCNGIVISLDATEEVINEAVAKKVNLVVAHHPIIFSGLKKITGKNYVERAIIAAIKNDIAIYAIHTNLDNVLSGVNGKMAKLLGLKNCTVLSPKPGTLKKLYTFVPASHSEQVRSAIFGAGAGNIGNYSECSFNVEGTGTFKAGEGANPFVGNKNERHHENEIRIETIFPGFLENKIVAALKAAHPYEEVAFDIVSLTNLHPGTGSGLIGELEKPADETGLLELLKKTFNCGAIRHTRLLGKPVKKIALCGGAGSFLIKNAIAAGADFYISADIKYHEFFDANGQLVIADIGHYESEQFTLDLLKEVLEQKFPTFAVLKTEVITNPVRYL
jgi:dinuclear metal center YbgI/SA1388 family protein